MQTQTQWPSWEIVWVILIILQFLRTHLQLFHLPICLGHAGCFANNIQLQQATVVLGRKPKVLVMVASQPPFDAIHEVPVRPLLPISCWGPFGSDTPIFVSSANLLMIHPAPSSRTLLSWYMISSTFPWHPCTSPVRQYCFQHASVAEDVNHSSSNTNSHSILYFQSITVTTLHFFMLFEKLQFLFSFPFSTKKRR